MIFGLPPFVFVHVLITLIAIFTGFIVVFALFGSSKASLWTLVFLLFTVLTNVTGFALFAGQTPAFFTGIISSVVVLITILARYSFHLAGAWRTIYAVGAVISLYLNVFVLITQSFLKIPQLHALAPNAPAVPEPPFAIAQGVTLLAFIAAGYFAANKFKPA